MYRRAAHGVRRLHGRALRAVKTFKDGPPYVDSSELINKLDEHEFLELWSQVYAYGPPEEPILGLREVWTNKDKDYCCSGPYEEMAKTFIEYGIAPELIDDEASVCSIGWSEVDQAYYGWSHRAIQMFKIGDKIFEEDFVGATDSTPFRQHGERTIKSKQDAREAAVNFARYIG